MSELEIPIQENPITLTVSAAADLINLYERRQDHLFADSFAGTKAEYTRAHNLLRVLSEGNPQPVLERMPWFNSALIDISRWTTTLLDAPNKIEPFIQAALRNPFETESLHILAACQLAQSIISGNPSFTVSQQIG